MQNTRLRYGIYKFNSTLVSPDGEKVPYTTALFDELRFDSTTTDPDITFDEITINACAMQAKKVVEGEPTDVPFATSDIPSAFSNGYTF